MHLRCRWQYSGDTIVAGIKVDDSFIAVEQDLVAAATDGAELLAGVPAAFSGALRMNSVEILGVRVISAGVWEGGEQLTSTRAEGPLYRKLICSEGRLNGFLLLGDVRCAGVLTSLVKNRTEVSVQALARDLERGFSYRPRLYALGGSVRTLECGGVKN